MIKITNGGGAGRIFYCEKFTRKIWLDFKFHEYSASIHRDAMQNAYVHAYDRTANISYMLKEYLKDAWLFRSCSRRRRKTEEWRKKGERGFLPFVRNHENLRLLRFVSIWLDPHRNYGMARSLCHWQLDSPHYSRRVTDFSFPRKFPYSRLWQEISPVASLSFLPFPFLPSFLPCFLPSFFPSFLRFLRFQSLRSRGAAFLSIRAWRKIRYRVSLFLWFQPLREISFSLNHRRMEELGSFGVDIHLSFTKVVARFANHLSHIRHFSLSSFNTFSFSLSLFLIFLILP